MAEKTNITKDTPPSLIEEDIARTRAEMSGTVNEIEERLSAGHLKEEAKQKIRSSTVDKVRSAASRFGESAKGTGSTIVNTVKDNPIPIAMMSVGLGWLLLNRSRNGSRRFMTETGSTVKAKAGELTEKAKMKAGELSGQVRETGSEFAGRAKQSAQQISRAAQERARGAKTGIQRMIQDNPIGIALAAMAVGAAAGLSIPETRKEKEMMGPASESLIERAKETAQRTIEKAQHAAEKAVQTAEEEFKKTA